MQCIKGNNFSISLLILILSMRIICSMYTARNNFRKVEICGRNILIINNEICLVY